jgi:hypothetical protein
VNPDFLETRHVESIFLLWGKIIDLPDIQQLAEHDAVASGIQVINVSMVVVMKLIRGLLSLHCASPERVAPA